MPASRVVGTGIPRDRVGALRSIVIAGVLAAGIAACARREPTIPSEMAGLPPRLASEIVLAKQRAPDQTLHDMQAASLGLWYGDAPLATEHLDRAIAEIETLYVGSDNAAVNARKLYHEEREKPFKGEPYERMMVYVYRGVLEYGQRDYGGAAASFRAAILQDAFADEQQNQCDFELAEYLLARAIMRERGDRHLIEEASERAETLARSHGTDFPRLDPADNVILFVEVGPAPFKVAQGEEDELLVIGRRGADGMHAEVTVDGAQPVATKETGNLAFQAMTRGGRQFDFILAGKAYTKQMTKKSGLTINQIGTAISFVVPIVGAPIQIAGLIVKASGIGIKPTADKRYWRTLPDSIHIMPLKLALGRHTIQVAFYNHFGEHVAGKDLTYYVEIGPQTEEMLLWASSQDEWPERMPTFQ